MNIRHLAPALLLLAAAPATLPRGDAKRDDGASYEQSLFNDLVTDRKDTVVREQTYRAGS